MNNLNCKLKIPSALQRAWQRCVVVTLCMVLVVFGCKDDKEAQKMDEASFVESMKSAPVSLVNLEQLPEWLQSEINSHIAGAASSAHYIAYKGEWEQKTIYNVTNVFKSSVCDFRYENGSGIEVSFLESLFAKSKNWTLIYEYIGENAPIVKSINLIL